MKNLNIISSIFLIGVLLLSCQKEYFDYSYRIKNNSSYDTIVVTCSVTTSSPVMKKDSTFILEKGKTFPLCSRLDVAGQSIWDIENSIKLYKIKELAVKTADGIFKTQELSYRRYWDGPFSEDGKGVYELNFTDNLFTNKLQNGYEYIVKNELPDKLCLSYSINSDIDSNMKNDTIPSMTSKTIAIADIHSYLGDDTDLYTEAKLSGLKLLTLKYKDIKKSIDKKRDTSLFRIFEDSCVIIIKPELFE